MHLRESDYRRWMVLIAAATLILSALRLWLGQ
jgi:hypothetical protein